jgi:antitoxin HigA-1
MAQTPIHPGEHLAEELEALGISAAAFARQLDVPTNRITGILNGQRSITGDTALRLAHFFGTSAAFWLNLQSLYDLRLADLEAVYPPTRASLAAQQKCPHNISADAISAAINHIPSPPTRTTKIAPYVLGEESTRSFIGGRDPPRLVF